jgi:hypothetical protein
MPEMKILLKILAAAALAVLFFYCLWFVGCLMTGAGHGTGLFVGIVVSPFNIVDIPVADYRISFAIVVGYWICTAVFLVLRREVIFRNALYIFLTVHYLGVVIACSREDWSHAARVWNVLPGWILLFLVVYLGCQFVIWFLIIRDLTCKPASRLAEEKDG